MSVCLTEPCINGLIFISWPFLFMWTIKSNPNFSAVLSLKSIISENFHVVSICIIGKGGFAGWNAFIARCSITEESLPIE